MANNDRVILLAVTLNAEIGANADALAEVLVEDIKGSIEVALDDANDPGSGEDHEHTSGEGLCWHVENGEACRRTVSDHCRSLTDRYGHFGFTLVHTAIIKP